MSVGLNTIFLSSCYLINVTGSMCICIFTNNKNDDDDDEEEDDDEDEDEDDDDTITDLRSNNTDMRFSTLLRYEFPRTTSNNTLMILKTS